MPTSFYNPEALPLGARNIEDLLQQPNNLPIKSYCTICVQFSMNIVKWERNDILVFVSRVRF